MIWVLFGEIFISNFRVLDTRMKGELCVTHTHFILFNFAFRLKTEKIRKQVILPTMNYVGGKFIILSF